jgi:hypothetical protein
MYNNLFIEHLVDHQFYIFYDCVFLAQAVSYQPCTLDA